MFFDKGIFLFGIILYFCKKKKKTFRTQTIDNISIKVNEACRLHCDDTDVTMVNIKGLL